MLLPLGRSLTALPHSHSLFLLLAHHRLQAHSSLVALQEREERLHMRLKEFYAFIHHFPATSATV